MAVRYADLERLAEWCAGSEELADAVDDAAELFYGKLDELSGTYEGEVGDLGAVQRRFFGWFTLGHRLPGGDRPGEIAARALFSGRKLVQVLTAVGKAEYVVGAVTAVLDRRSVFVEGPGGRFEIRDRKMADPSIKGFTVCSWVVPAPRGVWTAGPGWVVVPLALGPGLRENLEAVQFSPMDVERFLRAGTGPGEGERPAPPDLSEAVERITKAAEADRRPGLVMTETRWIALVLQYLPAVDAAGFFHEVADRVGEDIDTDGLNAFVKMAQDIWNATPQPDRDLKTANELIRERRRG